jgi:1-acyl-sn-glycerol-3-phosphate acyltransferase
MFPEGRINLEPEKLLLIPGRSGAAFVAIKARVPVIPMYVSGSPYDGTALGSFFMPAHARVIVGDPIDISAYYGQDEKEVLGELTKRFLIEIAKLAGREDFQPELAGRRWKLGAEEENGEPQKQKTPA